MTKPSQSKAGGEQVLWSGVRTQHTPLSTTKALECFIPTEPEDAFPLYLQCSQVLSSETPQQLEQ